MNILADISKLGQRSILIFAPLAEVDILNTDRKADTAILREIKDHGVDTMIAEAANSDIIKSRQA